MKTAGIIAEYNPFHNGHAALVEKAREMGATHIAAVMSGSFVQRGEPAIMSTEARVKAALDGGADLVLQLPLPYALGGAAVFARGGVSVLDATGVVDSLVFGSECGDINTLNEISSLLASEETDEKIKGILASGVTYAKAREEAVSSVNPAYAEVLKEPNNILGIEYLNALSGLKSDMKPVTFSRVGTGHDTDDISGCFASASEIRRRILAGEDWKKYVPDACEYPENGLLTYDSFNKLESMILYKMRTATPDEIAISPDVSEGIENRIAAAGKTAMSLDELYSSVKTKRYTHARIRRIVLSTFLGIRASDTATGVPYIRVLGFSEKGRELLKIMKKSGDLPVVTKAADMAELGEKAGRMFELECNATSIRNLLTVASEPHTEEKNLRIIQKNCSHI